MEVRDSVRQGCNALSVVLLVPYFAWGNLTTRELVEIRDLSGVSVAPNGAYAAVRMDSPSVESNSIQLDWYVVPLNGSGHSQRLVTAGEPSLGENGTIERQTPQWSGDSQWLYYRALHEGEMQIWRTRLDEGVSVQLTHDASNVTKFTLDETQHRLFFEVGATRNEILREEQDQYDNGILNDRSLFPGYPVARSFPLYGRASMYRRYRDLNGAPGDTHGGLLADRPQRVVVLSLKSGLTHSASADEVQAYQRLLAHSIAVGTQRSVACRDALCDKAGTVFGSDRYGRGGCSFTRGEAICIVSRSSVPPRVEAVVLRDGRSRTLFNPNSRISPERLATAEKRVIRNEYGEEAAAFLVLPKNHGQENRLPLVITSYTCDGFLQGGSGDDVPELLLAGQGIASICLNDNGSVRRVPKSESLEEAAQKSSLAFRKAAIDVLNRRGLIDATRVAVTGLSYGATSTLYAISHSSLFAAAQITSQGYDDPMQAYFYGASDIYRETGASPYLNPDYFGAISPALNAERIRVPLLMQLADTEYLQMMQLYSNLRDLNRPVEMIVYPDEYHIKWQPRHRLAVYDRSVAWMRFWLQGYEDKRPSMASMYQRWRSMRSVRIERISTR
jgi:dienelactone hydrolase